MMFISQIKNFFTSGLWLTGMTYASIAVVTWNLLHPALGVSPGTTSWVLYYTGTQLLMIIAWAVAGISAALSLVNRDD
jgi:hypothetical protein